MNAPLVDRYPLAIKLYPYARHKDQMAQTPAHHPIVIVGGGPVGLATALDLGLRGQKVVVLDDHEGVGQGSRAICFSKRTLEIAHRLGAGAAMLEKGVIWQKGRVFYDRDELFTFDLLPEIGHRCPAFINLQQPYIERYLFEAIERANANGARIDIRGKNRLDSLDQDSTRVSLGIMTPDGPYNLTTDWVIASDGANSPTRKMMGLDFDGRVFDDHFLIADVRMKADFPTERWFWFNPWFKSGASALLHKQPDDIWRIDFQLGHDIDRSEELKEDNIRARVDAMLGPDVSYDLDWCSIYKFQCRRMEKFRHNKVIFVGDAAHQVSPFGARGANSGIQDADNLGWKLDLVCRGVADQDLLDSYASEREFGADENILNSTRATDFMTPKSEISTVFRDAVLDLAKDHSFARPLVNSGRLSVPCAYQNFPNFMPDGFEGPDRTRPGFACPDAPLGVGYLLDKLTDGFMILGIGTKIPTPVTEAGITAHPLEIAAPTDDMHERYLGASSQAVYLIRPDQHIVGRWPNFDAATIANAIRRALGKDMG